MSESETHDTDDDTPLDHAALDALRDEQIAAYDARRAEPRLCSECERTRPRGEFEWAHDRYGIPYRLVCEDCVDKVETQIGTWEFDPLDAGESLD